MNNKASKRSLGFTLIELLVVISVIGMLASIVLAATANTRFKAKTVVMKKEMQQLVLATTIYYDSRGGQWGGDLQHIESTCPTTGNTMFAYPEIKKQLDAIAALFPGSTLECLATTDISPFTNPPAKFWMIYLQVPGYSGGTNKWCIDNYDISGLPRPMGLSGSYSRSVTKVPPVTGTPVVARCDPAFTSADW